jgi:RNA polymerase sigma-54 factor
VNLGLDFGMNMGLEQKLSPQMIQSLQLLQMNSLELEMAVKQELETNPLLETAEDAEEEGDAPATTDVSDPAAPESDADAGGADAPANANDDASDFREDRDDFGGNDGSDLAGSAESLPGEDASGVGEGEIDWESYIEDGYDPADAPREEREDAEEPLERTPVYDKSLQDHLLDQLHDREATPEVAELVEYLIYSLDERGWLVPDAVARGADAADAGERKAPFEDGDARHRQIQDLIEGALEPAEADAPVREALHVLQSMDPPGIGARNLQECLLLQMRRSGKASPLARRIVEEGFDLLERLKIAALAKKLDETPEAVQAAVREIGALEPHPGRLLASTAAAAVVPDLLVEEVDGELVLMLNDRTMPSLRISRAYANLLRKGSRATADEKKYVRGKLNAATWLIRAIEQRKSTMLKVMHAILESQPEFFRSGPAHLRPLILQQVADKIGMHISTVSRVTNGKYVQTPHGIFELKYFFSAGVTQSDGSEVSSVAARDEIKRLIESEDASSPLSDQKIVEILKSRGLDVARRTVAKYRDQLEILPARLRRKF